VRDCGQGSAINPACEEGKCLRGILWQTDRIFMAFLECALESGVEKARSFTEKRFVQVVLLVIWSEVDIDQLTCQEPEDVRG
jgi:hypothetical protein